MGHELRLSKQGERGESAGRVRVFWTNTFYTYMVKKKKKPCGVAVVTYRKWKVQAAGKSQHKAQENNMCAHPLIYLNQILQHSFNKSGPFACKSHQLPASIWRVSISAHRAGSCLICSALKHKLLCGPCLPPPYFAEDLTLRKKRTIPPPLKQKLGNCLNCRPRHK